MKGSTPNYLSTVGDALPPAETIYESAPVASDDEFWLEQSNKLLAEAVNSVRGAASELLKASSLLQGIYLGIVGFGDLVPRTLALGLKTLFILPVIALAVAIYLCLRVLMTESLIVNPHSPSDIKKVLNRLANDKQRDLRKAFAVMTIGLIIALSLLVFRMQI